MPRRIYRKRRAYRKKKATLATKVAKLTKMVKVAKPELKYYYNQVSTTFNNGPTTGIFPYRSLVQGLTDSTRIGDDVRMKKFQYRSYCYLPAGGNGSVCRIVAFVFKRNPDAVTTAFSTTINLALDSAFMNTINAVNNFNDWDNHSSFAILYDKTFVINPSTSDKATVRKHDFSITLPDKYAPVTYSQGGSNPTQNELVIAYISSNDDVIYLEGQWRIQYTDA